HAWQPEVENQPGVQVLTKPFVVNNTAGPLAPELQRPFTALLRIESGLMYDPKNPPQSFAYNGAAKPHNQPRKTRTVEPYTTRLAPNQLWAETWGANT